MGNIVSASCIFPIPHNLTVYEDRAELFLPNFKKGEGLFITVTTRENKLKGDEIDVNYTANPHIESGKAIVATLAIFLVMSVLVGILDTKNSSS